MRHVLSLCLALWLLAADDSASGSRRRNLRILPTLVRGSSSTNVMLAGSLRLRQPLRAPRVQLVERAAGSPGRSATTNATGTSSRIGSGWPTTAASSTPGCADSTCSTSTVDTFSPATFKHVGAPAVEPEPASGVAAGAVAGEEPAVAERRLGGDRIVEVAGEEREEWFAAHHDLAHLVGRRLGSVGSMHADRAAGRDETHRRRDGCVGMVGEDGRDRLGHAVQLPWPASQQ